MIAYLLAQFARLLSGCRARFSHEAPAIGPRIYFANHSSHLDALVIWASLPQSCRENCRIVAAEDYWTATPLRRWLAQKVFKLILIDRTSVRRDNNPMDRIIPALDLGHAVIIFPEGSRGDGDDLGDFRGGLWHIARKRPQIPLTPVWLENLNRVLPKGEFLPVPIMSAVTFGPSLNADAWDSKSAFLEAARTSLAQLRMESNH